MSNYSSYIHVSRLWPARPTISPIDAEWEHRACQRRCLGRWRGPFWHVIHHRFHLTAAAVSPSLSQTADLAEDTWEDGQTPLWDRWPADERAEKPSVILTAVTSLSIQNVSGRAAASWLVASPFIEDRMLRPLPGGGGHRRGGGGLDNCQRTETG